MLELPLEALKSWVVPTKISGVEIELPSMNVLLTTKLLEEGTTGSSLGSYQEVQHHIRR